MSVLDVPAAEIQNMIGPITGGHELLIMHGVFNIFAWMFLSAMGLFCVRHRPPKSLGGDEKWFLGHQIFMFLTWLLSIAAFVMIFVYIGDWVTSPHSIIGTITFGLAFIHPLLAVATRPGPNDDDHKRLMFGFTHMIGGMGVHIGALVTINKSYSLHRMQNVSRAFEIVFALYCGVHIVAHMIVSRINRPDYNNKVTKIFLVLYCILMLCFAVALIVLVAVADYNVPITFAK